MSAEQVSQFDPEETQSDLGPAIAEAYKLAGLARPEPELVSEQIPVVRAEPEERPAFIEPDQPEELGPGIDPNSEAVLGEEAIRYDRAHRDARRRLKRARRRAELGTGEYGYRALRMASHAERDADTKRRDARNRDLGEIHPAEFLQRSVLEHAKAALADEAFLQSLYDHGEVVARLSPAQLAERYARHQELIRRESGARYSGSHLERVQEALASLGGDVPPEFTRLLQNGSEVVQKQAVAMVERLRAGGARIAALETELQLGKRAVEPPRRLLGTARTFFGSLLEGVRTSAERGGSRIRKFWRFGHPKTKEKAVTDPAALVRRVATALPGDTVKEIAEKKASIGNVAEKAELDVLAEAAWTQKQQQEAHKRLRMLMRSPRLARLRDAQEYYETELKKHPGIFERFESRTSSRALSEEETQLELDYVIAATINTKMDAVIEEVRYGDDHASKIKRALSSFLERKQLGSKSSEEIRSFFKNILGAKAKELSRRAKKAAPGEREVLAWKKKSLEEIIREL